MNYLKNIKYYVIAIIVVMAAFVFLQRFESGDVSVSINLRSDAELLIEKLGTPNAATDISKISIEGPDGPMPEIAVRSFNIKDSSETVRRFYQQKCVDAEFAKPDKELLQLEPTAICEGRSADGKFTVLLFLKCSELSCFVRTEVRHFI